MVLARAPEIVTWLGVTERIGAFQHPLNSVSRGLVQRDRSLARLVLAVSDVEHALTREYLSVVGDTLF